MATTKNIQMQVFNGTDYDTLYPKVNLANSIGVAPSATKLETAKTIRTNLASTSAASFNGTTNITPGVTGILPVANGGTGVNNIESLKSTLGGNKVGDILYTVRNDLDDNWLLCDGSEVDTTTCPDLSYQINETTPLFYNNIYSKISVDVNGGAVKYGNGYNVFVGTDGYVYYNAFDSDSFVKGGAIPNYDKYYTYTLELYANGYYIIIGQYHVTSSNKRYINNVYYSNNLNEDFTLGLNFSQLNGSNGKFLTYYYNNKFFFFVESDYSNTKGKTYYTTNFSTVYSKEWTKEFGNVFFNKINNRFECNYGYIDDSDDRCYENYYSDDGMTWTQFGKTEYNSKTPYYGINLYDRTFLNNNGVIYVDNIKTSINGYSLDNLVYSPVYYHGKQYFGFNNSASTYFFKIEDSKVTSEYNFSKSGSGYKGFIYINGIPSLTSSIMSSDTTGYYLPTYQSVAKVPNLIQPNYKAYIKKK